MFPCFCEKVSNSGASGGGRFTDSFFCGGLEGLESSADDVNFCPVVLEGFGHHETNSCSTTSDYGN